MNSRQKRKLNHLAHRTYVRLERRRRRSYVMPDGRVISRIFKFTFPDGTVIVKRLKTATQAPMDDDGNVEMKLEFEK